ncbi:MAG: RICIN domain-containing protein [Desulfovibrionaceae bacterium]|nr:RICIN domain-containing protein [Desulfovibrionaceae bacterium]
MKNSLRILCAFFLVCFVGLSVSHAAVLPDGRYHIKFSDRYVSAPAMRNGTILALSYSTKATVWELKHLGNDVYSIRAKSKCMDSSGGKRYDGVPIILYDYYGHQNQRWKIEKYKSYYILINVKTGLALDVPAGKAAVGAQLQGYPVNRSRAQCFNIYTLDKPDTSLLNLLF